MHKPEFGLENETHKIIWDFVIQTYYQILARRPDNVIINKKKRPPPKKNEEFFPPSGVQGEKKRKERQSLRSCPITKKALKFGGDGDTNCYWRTWNGLLRLGKWTG